MNLFDALLLVDIFLVIVAGLRLQPAAFVWIGQQCVTLRALSNIQDYGPPSTQWWLPPSLFNQSALNTAFLIFLVSTLITAAMMFFPARSSSSYERVAYPRMPGWLIGIVWAFFLVQTLSHKSIFSAGSTSSDATVFEFNFGGGNALMCGLLMYEYEMRRLAGRVSGAKAFIIVGGVLTISFMLQGATGYVTGCLLFAAFLYLPTVRLGPLPGYATIGLAVAALIATTTLVRAVRGSLNTEGTRAVSGAVAGFEEAEQTRAQTGTGIESRLNGDQSAAHVVECINLWESHLGRSWHSIYYPLIYTFEPSFLLEPLHLTRPREAATELYDYYIHMGGIQAQGEMYWNGGMLCVVVVVTLLSLLSRRCDQAFQHRPYWLMLASNYVPSLFIGGHYGFAQIVRGVFNGLIGCALIKIFARRKADLSEKAPPHSNMQAAAARGSLA